MTDNIKYDSNIFYTDGTPLVIEGANSTLANWEGLAWTSTSANAANVTIDTYLNMSNDGYADLARKLEKFLTPAEVIVKCGHCGQWGAVKTQCKHCGAAVG